MKQGITVAIVVFFAAVSVAPALAEKSWWNSSIFGDGWCYGDVDLGECSVDIYEFDPAEWCRQPREATTSLEYCQNPDNYSRAVMDPEICGVVSDYRGHASLPPPPLVPSGIPRVLSIVTDASSYSRDDRITFSGTTQGTEVREIVSVVIESPRGSSKIRSGLTSSDNTFTLSPMDVKNAFGDPGIYTIKAFTNSQGASYAATLDLRYECSYVTRHSASADPHLDSRLARDSVPQSYVDRHNDDAASRAWSESSSLGSKAGTGAEPSTPSPPTLTQEPELMDFFLIDPDGLLVKDRWCYGIYTYCEDTYANWWNMTLYVDYDLITDEHWCFDSLQSCESNPDNWCKGTYAHCYDQAGHAWNSELLERANVGALGQEDDQAGHAWNPELLVPHAYAPPTNITRVVSPWEFEWSRISSIAYSWDTPDNNPPIFVKRPTSETIMVKGGNYTLSLSLDNFVVVDDVDPEPIVDCIVGGVPAIMQDIPHEWVLETGTHYVQCTSKDDYNTSGVSYRLVVNTVGDLFPSNDHEQLFERITQFYGSTLNHDQMLKIIKWFHSAGILMFDIEHGNGLVWDPADAICNVRDTDQNLLGKISLSVASNAQKKHCLELLAEHGAFSRILP